MIYPENFESKIGFDRIRNQIAVLCITDGAREKLSGLHFSTSREEIVRLLEETFEMRTILMLESDFPESNYVDTALFLKKAEVTGAFLETGEILTLRKGLTAAYELVRFFGSDSGAKYPRLRALSRDVQGFPEIINHIDSIIDRFGKVKDSASPELYTVRRSIREREGQISRRLQQIMSQAQAAGLVDADASVSIREGRAVIPVSAEKKTKYKRFQN